MCLSPCRISMDSRQMAFGIALISEFHLAALFLCQGTRPFDSVMHIFNMPIGTLTRGKRLLTPEIFCAWARESGAGSTLITMDPLCVCFCRVFGNKCLGASVLVFQGTSPFDLVMRPRCRQICIPFELNVFSQPGFFASGQGNLGLVCSSTWSLAVFLEPHII